MQQLFIPAGYQDVDEFNGFGLVVNVPAGSGVGAVQPVTVLSRDIPPGAKVLLVDLSLRVFEDQGLNQVFFHVFRNGQPIYPFFNIVAELQRISDRTPAQILLDPGLLAVVVKNISGTAEAGASEDALEFRVQATWTGRLLAPVNQGVLLGRSIE